MGSLQRDRSGKIARVVGRVAVQLHHPHDGRILICTQRTTMNGATSGEAQFPFRPLRPDENAFICARRVLMDLRVQSHAILVKDETKVLQTEEEDPEFYPGLRVVTRVHLLKATLPWVGNGSAISKENVEPSQN